MNEIPEYIRKLYVKLDLTGFVFFSLSLFVASYIIFFLVSTSITMLHFWVFGGIYIASVVCVYIAMFLHKKILKECENEDEYEKN